jgi:hypothetical protein
MRTNVALLTPEQPEKGDSNAEKLKDSLTDQELEDYDIPEFGDVGHLIREEDR